MYQYGVDTTEGPKLFSSLKEALAFYQNGPPAIENTATVQSNLNRWWHEEYPNTSIPFVEECSNV